MVDADEPHSRIAVEERAGERADEQARGDAQAHREPGEAGRPVLLEHEQDDGDLAHAEGHPGTEGGDGEAREAVEEQQLPVARRRPQLAECSRAHPRVSPARRRER